MDKPAGVNVQATKTIHALRDGQAGVIEQLYDQYRKEFMSWAGQRFSSTPGDIEDAWQEAVVVFYRMVMMRKLTILTCSVKTFLFAIGYKWLLKNGRKLRRMWWKGTIDSVLSSNSQIAAISFQDDDWEEEKLLLREAMQSLSPSCREILVARHFEDRTIEEILTIFSYANKNAVSATLSNCLSKLKAIIKEKSNP